MHNWNSVPWTKAAAVVAALTNKQTQGHYVSRRAVNQLFR